MNVVKSRHEMAPRASTPGPWPNLYARSDMAQSTEVERFWSKVQKTDTCWLWTGTPTPAGYGKFGARRTMVLVHRYAYELLVGPIPEGLELDHLCFVKLCVNPAHLEPVTGAENTRRYWASRTACRNGHPYSTENTYWYRGVRECRVCQRAYEAGLRDRRRERSGKGRQRHYPGLRTGNHTEAGCPKCRARRAA